MLAEFAGHLTVYLVTGYTDMRKSIDGLAAIVQGILHMDPFSRSMFFFVGEGVTVLRLCYGKMMDSFFYTKD